MAQTKWVGKHPVKIAMMCDKPLVNVNISLGVGVHATCQKIRPLRKYIHLVKTCA